MIATRFSSAALLISLMLFSSARGNAQGPPNPCCAIVAVDAATGIATAKITADGRVFQFKAKNPAITTLQLGQSVYANFAKNQVSVDGRTVCCVMTSGPQSATAAADATTPAPQPTPAPAASVAPPSSPERAPAVRPGACCGIVGVDANTGIVTAKVNASGNVFGFKPSNPAVLASLQPGQAVYVNFTSHQVSLDGRTLCCLMLGDPQPATVASTGREAPAAVPVTPVATTSSSAPPSGGGRSLGAIATRAIDVQAYSLPSITYGTPRPATGAAEGGMSHLGAKVSRLGGGDATNNVVRLRGVQGIDEAQDLPEGAKRLLQIHVRTLGADEPSDYIVNTTLAAKWMATHHVPDDVKPPASGNSHSGCNSWSIHCAGEVEKHAADQGSKEWEKLRKEAQGVWDHASDELTHDWNMAQDCFADHTLPLNGIPVKFAIQPNVTISLPSNAFGHSSSFSNANSSGKVDGSVGIGFPMEGDFVAQLKLFYIPCLPFVVRPKSIAADGTMGIGEKLTASVIATGSFDKTFKIPPTGGPKIPIQVIPIVIGGVPVAEMDVSAYIEGNIEVGGTGKADAHFELSDPHKVQFKFDCNGGGCSSVMQPVSDTAMAMESAEIKGQVWVKPSVYTALQLDFDYDLLSARAGPQPFLKGMASGCAETSARQTSDGKSTSEENHALMADLDWGIELRAEALVADQIVGQPWTHKVTGDHIWFRDLAPGGSNALVANVQSVGTAQVAKPMSYKVKMPSCYPYTNKVQYRVTWTGGATPTTNTLCQWQVGKGLGTCQGDPTKDLVMSFTWPNAGVYSLSVITVGDDHHRSFSSAPQVTTVTVAAAPGGG